MNLSYIKRLYLITFIFTALCLGAYFNRGDYYHKQSDQFYYLSMADSLREEGVMKERVDVEHTISPTYTTAATLVMLPFSKMRVDHVFLCVCLLYFVLNLLSIFPLYRLLTFLGVKEKTVFAVLTLYFTSFPITMFKLWPINEGPSLFLVSWFLYFTVVAPKTFFYILSAFLAPAFRAHIYFVEISLFIYGLIKRKWVLCKRGGVSFLVSIFGLWSYLRMFPANQPRLAKEVLSGTGLLKIGQEYLLATVHLFVPEGGTQWAFGDFDSSFTSIIGFILVTLALYGFLKHSKKESQEGESIAFGFSTFLISSVAVICSLIIIARFHTVGYLWLLLVLYLTLEKFTPKLSLSFFCLVAAINLTCMIAFWLTRSTDPAYKAAEGIKKLSERAAGYPVVYEHNCLPVHPRQIYAYFRRPTEDLDRAPMNEKFILLTDHTERLGDRFKGCKTEEFLENPVTLMKVDCTMVAK